MVASNNPFADVRPYMPLQWLPVSAGYTRTRKTAGYAGGYLFMFWQAKIHGRTEADKKDLENQ